MPKLPVSVHILTWNSSRTIERSIRSVGPCAEVLVIDGGSQDETAALAEKLGARVIPQRFPGAQGKPLMDFSAARNVGLENATQPWILALDSDEVMAPQALEEIDRIVSRPEPGPEPEPDAYWLPRHYVLDDGRQVVQASTYPNERLYFFRKDAVERWEKPVHERVKLKEGVTIGRLTSGSLAPLPPISVFRSKLHQYLRIEVDQSRGTGWNRWIARVLHTARGRALASLRLMRIWLIPGPGPRLPIRYEMARFWYSWKLVVMTCPIMQKVRTVKDNPSSVG